MTMTERLEERARLIQREHDHTTPVTPKTLLEQELMLVLEQLDHNRIRREQHFRWILQDECAVNTDLMAIECYEPLVFSWRGPVRDNLKSKLLNLNRERRHVHQLHDQEEGRLHHELLRILGQHAHLE